jgi:hypothetical protein
MPNPEGSPLERAREKRISQEEAYGREGKRPLSLERAQQLFDEQMEFARSHEIKERKLKARREYDALVASSIPSNLRSTVVASALEAAKRIRSGEYSEKESIRKQAELLVKFDHYEFGEAFAMIGSVVTAIEKEGLPPEVNEEFTPEEEEQMRKVAVRMTRHRVERDILYRNGVFATEELAPLLGFTETEVRIDERERQLELFRNKS